MQMTQNQDRLVLNQLDPLDEQILRTVRSGFSIKVFCGSLTDAENDLWLRLDEAEAHVDFDGPEEFFTAGESALLVGALKKALTYRNGYRTQVGRTNMGSVPSLADQNIDVQAVEQILPKLEAFMPPRP